MNDNMLVCRANCGHWAQLFFVARTTVWGADELKEVHFRRKALRADSELEFETHWLVFAFGFSTFIDCEILITATYLGRYVSNAKLLPSKNSKGLRRKA